MSINDKAKDFYNGAKEIFDEYLTSYVYVDSLMQFNQICAGAIDKDDIVAFFTSETGEYSKTAIDFFEKCKRSQCRVWAIATEGNTECRTPPKPIDKYQSFDVASRNENRNPLKNNMRAIAQIFARKVISQTLSPFYRDEVLYFISHKRSDGEHLAARLADALRNLTRERNVYRDVVNVEVGQEAQEDIDKHLSVSDVLIFLQTEESSESCWIIKELSYALLNDIPVLWIQIDDAPYKKLDIIPGEKPSLRYSREEFDDANRLEEIVNEVEEMCFQLIMQSSDQVFTYIEYLSDMDKCNKIQMIPDEKSILSYNIQYKSDSVDLYADNIKHYIQCFGRNPQKNDVDIFLQRMEDVEFCKNADNIFLLSNHGKRKDKYENGKFIEENYDDYIMNLENVTGTKRDFLNRKIIISGAFPDCDEIYKNSLLEALIVYSREIIKNGYTLVFGAHPTFQNLIFDIGRLYSRDVRKSIEMHMDSIHMNEYRNTGIEDKCTLIISDGLDNMRKKMISDNAADMLICMGGKIKEDIRQQGVDDEVKKAKDAGIPVALVGTVGGRSSEMAHEIITNSSKYEWDDLNSWGKDFNEMLFYNINHRLMIKKLLEKISM
ncbi:MAG: TIR domain-containing protein [Lachnospiraceae bacterium]|nr:TIR domain-containing protein [Lachnospiraceae bacterium]MBR1598637.1 TIR domain-containing protein [Lachnospiraceae bacterium]